MTRDSELAPMVDASLRKRNIISDDALDAPRICCPGFRAESGRHGGPGHRMIRHQLGGSSGAYHGQPQVLYRHGNTVFPALSC